MKNFGMALAVINADIKEGEFMATFMESDKHLSHFNFTTKSVISGGAIGGVLAGLILAAVMMVLFAIDGSGFLTPVYLIAATFLGEAAVDGGLVPFAVGLVFHLFVSAGLGIIFALLTAKIHTQSSLLASGILFGVAVWAFMTYVALPATNEIMRDIVLQNPARWFINHVIFGLALSYVPYFERKKVRKESF